MIKNTRKKIEVKDHFLTQEQFSIHYTNLPGVLKTMPQPQHIDRYYNSSEYLSHDDSNHSLFARLYRFARKRNIKSKYKLLTRLTTDGKILDVGAGNGELVKYLIDRNLEAQGYEPNEQARKIAYQKGVRLLDHLPTEKTDYSVIQLFHVLEHVPDPEEIIRQLHQMLSRDGILIIALPNHCSWDAQVFNSYWAGYDVPRHLYHFNQEGIENITRNLFELIQTKPMWFDSLYVSILSARYKKWWAPLFTGIALGVVSNLKALWSKEPSSRIYIFKKAK